jgi:DNA polymerase-3 subunit chi
MTRIDFHFNMPDKLSYACRLVRKAHGAGSRLVVHTTDRALLNQLDQALWTFSALDFLPHCHAADALAADTPIILADHSCDTPHHDVLINLDAELPEFFTRFERLIEIVTTDEDDVVAGRKRWKFYKDRGYQLNRFDRAGVTS